MYKWSQPSFRGDHLEGIMFFTCYPPPQWPWAPAPKALKPAATAWETPWVTPLEGSSQGRLRRQGQWKDKVRWYQTSRNRIDMRVSIVMGIPQWMDDLEGKTHQWMITRGTPISVKPHISPINPGEIGVVNQLSYFWGTNLYGRKSWYKHDVTMSISASKMESCRHSSQVPS